MLCSFWAIIRILRQNVNSICVICAQNAGGLGPRASRRPLHIDKCKWSGFVISYRKSPRERALPGPSIAGGEASHKARPGERNGLCGFASRGGFAFPPPRIHGARARRPRWFDRRWRARRRPARKQHTFLPPRWRWWAFHHHAQSPSMKTPSPESWMYTADAASYVPSRSRSEISQSVALFFRRAQQAFLLIAFKRALVHVLTPFSFAGISIMAQAKTRLKGRGSFLSKL